MSNWRQEAIITLTGRGAVVHSVFRIVKKSVSFGVRRRVLGQKVGFLKAFLS